MGASDLEFARRSARYLRERGLRRGEVAAALVREAQCPPVLAERLAAAA